eukprot:gene9712-20194_t
MPSTPILPQILEYRESPRFQTIGCDMRTLRRQIEIINAEVDDCIKKQTILYDQNVELWNRLQALINMNDSNSSEMKKEMANINESVLRLQKRKDELTSKLLETRSSQNTLESILNDRKRIEIDVDDSQNICHEAEDSLQKSRIKTQDLELNLHTTITNLQHLHNELEEWKKWKYFNDLDEIADNFYVSSGYSLRASFRNRAINRHSHSHSYPRSLIQNNNEIEVEEEEESSLYSRQQLTSNKLFQFRNVNSTKMEHNQRHYQYQNKCQFHSSLHASSVDLKWIYFTQWKVYRALQQKFKSAHRRRLIQSTFNRMKKLVQLQLEEREHIRTADSWAMERDDRRLKSCVFSAWKNCTMFLEWDSEELWDEWNIAVNHNLCKIFAHWKGYAKESINTLHSKRIGVHMLKLRNKFLFWRVFHVNRCLVRELNFKRVFSKLKSMMTRKHSAMTMEYNGAVAKKTLRRMRCRRSMLKWRIYIGSHMAYVAWVDNSALMSYIRWKRLRCVDTLLRWRQMSTVNRRMKLCYKMSLRFRIFRLLKLGLKSLKLRRRSHLVQRLHRKPFVLLSDRGESCDDIPISNNNIDDNDDIESIPKKRIFTSWKLFISSRTENKVSEECGNKLRIRLLQLRKRRMFKRWIQDFKFKKCMRARRRN